MSDRQLKDKHRADIAKAATPKSEQDSKVGSAPTPEAKPRKLSKRMIIAMSAIGPVLAIALGMYLYLGGGRYISTDNAYIKSDKIAVSADISGRVKEVFVKANQIVKPGTLLFQLDPESFKIAVAQARGTLLAARHDGEAQKSLYLQRLAGLNQAKSDIQFFERRFNRQSKLKRKSIASQSTLDTAEQELQRARAQIGILEQDMAQALARLGGDINTPTDKLPGVLTARAALNKAELDLKRTEVRASVNGIITNFDLQKGEYVEEGTTVFSIVGTHDVWVEANFRETDLTFMRAGQTATIRIDAYPNDERKALVTSINPATGAEFALLPPQNATGNWVKVVQRLPVRLRLQDDRKEKPLRAGMSVIVKVDTQHERTMTDLLNAIRNWL
ncbi:MAG: HlyD family secretion protein [Pseudomonadota bacterium]